MKMQSDLRQSFRGLLLGTAFGDALGLPAEGLSRNRTERRWHGDWRHRFVFGHGMCSDDTEHAFFVAQALLSHRNDPVAFQRCLACKLRLWLLGAPAGVGLATFRGRGSRLDPSPPLCGENPFELWPASLKTLRI